MLTLLYSLMSVHRFCQILVKTDIILCKTSRDNVEITSYARYFHSATTLMYFRELLSLHAH